MKNRDPLSPMQRERIYLGKLRGQTLDELASFVDCSIGCARKWWRIGRDHGLDGLRAERRGRGPTGLLSHFDSKIAERALVLKQANPGWGANRLMIELGKEPVLVGLPLPCTSSLAAFFKANCPECVAVRKPREPSSQPALRATEAHQVWQLDSQECIQLKNGEIATICNIRDPYGAAMIASQAFEVRTERAHRKLKWTEVRQVLRNAFTEWRTMPDCILTDNELGLAGAPREPYPGQLTLWLIGLGIQHRFIRPGCPTDQSQVERNHRTMDGLALNDEALTDMVHLQVALDRERSVYNSAFPCHASDCQGQPPLTTHPELLRPRREYNPNHELAIFDIHRVLNYLSGMTFKRKLNSKNQVWIGRERHHFSVSTLAGWKPTDLIVRLDPLQNYWIFSALKEDVEVEIARHPSKYLNDKAITDIASTDIQPSVPLQMAFSFLSG